MVFSSSRFKSYFLRWWFSIATINNTGLGITGAINASTNLQEAGVNLISKYLQLAGVNMTANANITLSGTGTFIGKHSGDGSFLTNIPFSSITGTVNCSSLILSSSTQLSTRLSLTDQEYYVNGFTSTNGIGFLLGVSRDNNRQLWICDTAKTAQNTTNSVLRIIVGGTSESGIDAVATDGLTRHSLSIGGDALRSDVNAWGSMRKILKFHGVAVADDVAAMNNLIYTQGAFVRGVCAGDNFITSYWGLSILLNSGGWANGNGAGNNGRSYDAPFYIFNYKYER
jgi:hypothetical protein